MNNATTRMGDQIIRYGFEREALLFGREESSAQMEQCANTIRALPLNKTREQDRRRRQMDRGHLRRRASQSEQGARS
jgi:hypothetical protein